jgi:hypothetical protein
MVPENQEFQPSPLERVVRRRGPASSRPNPNPDPESRQLKQRRSSPRAAGLLRGHRLQERAPEDEGTKRSTLGARKLLVAMEGRRAGYRVLHALSIRFMFSAPEQHGKTTRAWRGDRAANDLPMALEAVTLRGLFPFEDTPRCPS